MKQLIITLIFIILTIAGQAQPDTLKLSVTQAVETGFQNRFDMKANQYNISVAQNQVTENKKQWLPEISGNGNLKYNAQLEKTVVPAGVLGNDAPMAVSLSTKYNSAYSLSLNQSVYNPTLSINTHLSKNELQQEKEKVRASKIEIKNQIKEAYLDVLLKNLQLKTARNDQNRYREYKELAEGEYRYGKMLENDYLRAKLDNENAKVTTEKLLQNYLLAVNYLKYTINIEPKTEIILTDSLTTLVDSQFRVQPSINIENRTEIKQLQLQQQNNRLQVQNARRINFPSVSVFANYSQEFQNDRFHYGENQSWNPFSYVGVKLIVPISDHFRNNNNRKKYQYLLAQTGMELQQTKTDIYFEIEKARTQLDNALKNMTSTHKNYDLSNKIYKNQKQQYQLGSFNYDHLLDTEKSLNTAEQNYIQSVYDYLIVKLDYEKVLGG